jgi:Sel1 repeat
MNKKQILSALIFMLSGAIANAGYEDAYAALQKKDYATAQSLLTDAAEKNDPRAFNALGIMSLQGLGVVRDPNLAITYFEKGAALGGSSAMNALAEMYGQGGGGVPKDIEKARNWAEKSGNANNPIGAFIFYQLAMQNELSVLGNTQQVDRKRYLEMAQRSIDERSLDKKAYSMLSRAAEVGYPPAALTTAVILFEHAGESNRVRANKLYSAIQTTLSNQLPPQMLALLSRQKDESNSLQSLGDTNTTPKIYKDALLTVISSAAVAVGQQSKGCDAKNIKVTKLEITKSLQNKQYLPVDGALLKDAILISGEWEESWTIDVCGSIVLVPIVFRADGGSGAYITVELAKVKIRE